jgi:hypothetical protein
MNPKMNTQSLPVVNPREFIAPTVPLMATGDVSDMYLGQKTVNALPPTP